MNNIVTTHHTQAVHHTNRMVGSWTDWELSDPGKEQAEHIGVKLSAELHGKYFTMNVSNLPQAKQTADTITKHLKIELIIREVMKENNLGIAVGKSV